MQAIRYHSYAPPAQSLEFKLGSVYQKQSKVLGTAVDLAGQSYTRIQEPHQEGLLH